MKTHFEVLTDILIYWNKLRILLISVFWVKASHNISYSNFFSQLLFTDVINPTQPTSLLLHSLVQEQQVNPEMQKLNQDFSVCQPEDDFDLIDWRWMTSSLGINNHTSNEDFSSSFYYCEVACNLDQHIRLK